MPTVRSLIQPVVIQYFQAREWLQSGVAYNPLSSALHADPYPKYRQLREKDPVHRSPMMGGWVLTRYDDVDTILRDWKRFTSSEGPRSRYDQDDQPTVVRRGEGMTMPAGTPYRFERSGDGPAVVLRVGGTTADSWGYYLKGDGSPLVIDYGSVTGTPVEGSFWTLDGVVEEQRVS